MSNLSKTLFALFASLSIAACSQSICPDGSQGSCDGPAANIDAGSGGGGGGGGNACDDPNLDRCDSICVDLDITPTFCGSCDNACSGGQGCSAGTCVDLCETGKIRCGGTCVDPKTDSQYCGASGSCEEFNIGTDCGTFQCSDGTCSTKRYLGSLTTSTGRWGYSGMPGVPGAVAACRSLYSEPTAVVCSYPNLVEAQANNELVNATDNNGGAVSQWWIVDATANQLRQCTKTNTGEGQWTYPTSHLLQGAKYVDLNAAAGTVSQVVDAPPNLMTGCGAQRNVPCCLP